MDHPGRRRVARPDWRPGPRRYLKCLREPHFRPLDALDSHAATAGLPISGTLTFNRPLSRIQVAPTCLIAGEVTMVDSYRPCPSHVAARCALTSGPAACGGKADAVSLVHAVEVPRLPVSRLEPVIGGPAVRGAGRCRRPGRPVLAGRTIWNVNSTVAGGGVAEMLQVLVGYVQDLDIAIGWLVITGDAGFFAITKRLHNQIHGSLSGALLGAAEAGHYAQMLAANAVELAARVRPGDVVLLHDPQTPGWPRRWQTRAPGWCGAATSAWTGKTR